MRRCLDDDERGGFQRSPRPFLDPYPMTLEQLRLEREDRRRAARKRAHKRQRKNR